MQGVEDGVSTEGKLSRPRCEVKIGAFNLERLLARGGAWVTRRFICRSGKVDVMAPPGEPEVGGSIPVGGVRMPRLAASRPAVRRPSLAGRDDA